LVIIGEALKEVKTKIKGMLIKHWTDIKTGDRLFKDTDFNDKGKNFFMKIVTWVISHAQNLRKENRGKKLGDGADHTETFIRINGELFVFSATKDKGVRPMPFHRWVVQEGNPKIEIIRRRIPYSTIEKKMITNMAFQDLGLPYALKAGSKALLGKDKKGNIDEVEADIESRGMICSETTARWDIDKYDWPEMLPKRLKELYLQNDASVAFFGRGLTLYKI